MNKVRSLLRRDRPTLLILTPPCGETSIQEQRRSEAMWDVAVELSLLQADLGGSFVLEHPQASRAWKQPATQQLRGVDELLVDHLYV